MSMGNLMSSDVGKTVVAHVRPVVITGDVTPVKQSFKAICDINSIVAGYRKTGMVSHVNTKKPIFGDFSSVPEYQKAQAVIIDSRERFAALPSDVRERFRNDPLEMLRFTADPKNRAEGVQLGLFKPVAAPAPAGGPPAVPVPVGPPPSA